jgi:LPS sulfotransferase NodH
MKNPIQREFNNIGREMYFYLYALFKKNNISDTRFILFSQGRTGSNLLRTLLHSHPDICCHGDIFVRRYTKMLFPRLFLKGHLAKATAKVYGFQLKRQVLEWFEKDAKRFLSDFHENGWKIIYLRRKNLFRRKLSAKIAIANQKWLYTADSHSEPPQSLKFHWNCNDLLASLEDAERQEQKDVEVLGQLPYLEIIYEDELSNSEQHQKTADNIFNFLGVQSATIQTNMVKTPFQSIEKIIENYDEVVTFLSQTKYAHFLEDNPNK